VLTTSGTATANLHPAVLEAWHAHVPLIVITASRPRSVINTGANQSTDQDQLFGRHVRGFAALSDELPDHRTWRFELARIVTAATEAPKAIVGFRDSLWPLAADASPFGELSEIYSLVRLPLSDSPEPPGEVALYEVDTTIDGAAVAPPVQSTSS